MAMTWEEREVLETILRSCRENQKRLIDVKQTVVEKSDLPNFMNDLVASKYEGKIEAYGEVARVVEDLLGGENK